MSFNKNNFRCFERVIADDVIAPFLSNNDKLNDNFLISRLSPFSAFIKSVILQKGFSHKTVVERNIYIRKTTDQLFSLLPSRLSHLFFASDDDIQLLAKECVEFCRKSIVVPNNVELVSLHNETVINESITVNGKNSARAPKIKKENTERIPVNGKSSNCDSVNEMSQQQQNIVYQHLCRYVTTFKISPPISQNPIKLSGCLKRLSDNRWWLRRIRKLITQANEKAALHLNLVNSKKQIYASNITTKNRIAQRLRNDELLSSSFIINKQGQRYSLKDISDLNVSNPTIRKDELICRARGFENLAKDLGHEALFITITCPSKYHRAFAKSGAPNPKWQGFMPDEANEYLNKNWQKSRAKFKRQGISIYGFRVVEPQHDGTPHWHMLFFVEKEKLEALKKIILHYALEEDGDEKGAVENRCDFKQIDPSKGSATGYILKYIVKNIDGEGVGEDKFGNNSIQVAQRIDAWASCWCIRQFQQIGGASVSIWRELRRLRHKFVDKKESVFEKARFAADNSDWQGYTIAMGGILCKQKDRPIQLHYELNINEQTGECLQSYYDGELILKIKGLWFSGKPIITRHYQWKIEKA
jgi:hypothetical protein